VHSSRNKYNWFTETFRAAFFREEDLIKKFFLLDLLIRLVMGCDSNEMNISIFGATN
jgi:hypothetical protein